MLLTTPPMFCDPPGFNWIEFLKKQNSQKQISISKTKTDVLVANWVGISPTYPIQNRILFCVSPKWTIIQKLSLCFTYFSIVLVFWGVVLLLLWSA